MDPQASFADAVARARQIAAKINKPVLDETQDNRASDTVRSRRKVRGKKERYRQAVDDRTGGAQCYTSPRDVLRSGLSVQRNKNVPQSARQAEERYKQHLLSLVSYKEQPCIDKNRTEEYTMSDEMDARYAGGYPGLNQSRNIDKEADQTAARLYEQMRLSSPDNCIMQPYNDKTRNEEYTTPDGMSARNAGGYPGLGQLRNTEVTIAAAQAAARINQQLGVSKPNSDMMQQQNDQLDISMVINEVDNQASGDSRQNDLQYASDVVKDIICTPCGDDGSKEAVSKYCNICQEYLCLTCARCHQRMKATRDHALAELQPEEHSYALVIEKCCYHPDRNVEMYCRTHDMVYCTRCIATEHRSCTGVTDVENAAEDENCTIREVQKLQDEMKVIYDQLEMCNKKKESVFVATEDQCSNIASKIREVKREMTNHIEKLEREALDVLKKTKAEIRNELETDMSSVNKTIGTVEERSKKMERAAHMDNVQKFVQVKLSQEVAKDARKLHEENKAKRQKVISCTENEQISRDFMKMQYICKISTFEQQKQLEVK